MADLNPSTTDAKVQRILPTSAAKVQRVSPSAPPSWSEECDKLLKTLGDDAKTLETAEHALAAVAAGTVDAAALDDPAIAALARHCEAASADEQSSRFGQAVSRGEITLALQLPGERHATLVHATFVSDSKLRCRLVS